MTYFEIGVSSTSLFRIFLFRQKFHQFFFIAYLSTIWSFTVNIIALTLGRKCCRSRRPLSPCPTAEVGRSRSENYYTFFFFLILDKTWNSFSSTYSCPPAPRELFGKLKAGRRLAIRGGDCHQRLLIFPAPKVPYKVDYFSVFLSN